ncbi:MAG: hypothetical protein V4535_05355 [Bacteroidota bacterium]
MMFKVIITIAFIIPLQINAQSDLQTIIKGGELLLSGLSILKVSESNAKGDSKVIESVCVKNKLADKITFKLVGKNDEGDQIKKELVIPKDGKECLLLVTKGIYTYEIALTNKEIYKKGEYKFDEDIVMTIKQE